MGILALLAVFGLLSLASGQVLTGYIAVYNALDNSFIGYFGLTAADNGFANAVTDLTQVTTFSFTPSSTVPFEINIVSPAAAFPVLGGIDFSGDLLTGSATYLGFQAAASTAAGPGTPQTPIWLYDSVSNRFSVKWINSNSAPAIGYFTSVQSSGITGVLYTGDLSTFDANFGNTNPFPLYLTFVPVTPSGSISGDPHFTGFKGEKYNFLGEDKKWFNLITSPHFQMNAYFQAVCDNKQYMTSLTSIAINMKESKFLVNVHGNGLLDGKEISTAPRNKPFLARGNGQIVHPWPNYWEVSTNEFSFVIERQYVDKAAQKPTYVYYGENCLDGYFNIKVQDKNITSPTHGLLGQTAHHNHTEVVDDKDKEGNGEIEGSYKDYIVSSPFGSDFKFNLYSIFGF